MGSRILPNERRPVAVIAVVTILDAVREAAKDGPSTGHVFFTVVARSTAAGPLNAGAERWVQSPGCGRGTAEVAQREQAEVMDRAKQQSRPKKAQQSNPVQFREAREAGAVSRRMRKARGVTRKE
jgi:hypothetical protein